MLRERKRKKKRQRGHVLCVDFIEKSNLGICCLSRVTDYSYGSSICYKWNSPSDETKQSIFQQS